MIRLSRIVVFPSRIVQKSRLSFPRKLVPVGGPPSRAWVQATRRELFSPLPVVPICFALSISPSEEEGRVLVYPESVYPEWCTLVC